MPTKEPFSYQQLSSELDKIVSDLQSGELDIDEAIEKYQRGSEVIAKLQEYLKTAENKITKLNITFDKQR